jgi:hypothetical protein
VKGVCPFCKALILLRARKDFESFTKREVQDHIKQDHATELAKWHKRHPFGMPYIEVQA